MHGSYCIRKLVSSGGARAREAMRLHQVATDEGGTLTCPNLSCFLFESKFKNLKV